MPSDNTLDRATALLPALMAERLDEMGIDVSILYPSEGMHTYGIAEDELVDILNGFNLFIDASQMPRLVRRLYMYPHEIMPVQRIDGPEKATGRAKYSFDINRPGMLHARILRCPHGHACMRAITSPEVIRRIETVLADAGAGKPLAPLVVSR